MFCFQRKHLNLWVILNIWFYGEGLLAPRPTPKLEDHPSSAVRGCLFNLFTGTLHIGGHSSIRNPRTRHAVVTDPHPWTLFTYIMKSTNVYVWNIFHRVINYQHVSIPFAFIGVDLQEYKECNNLRHGISGTTKSYNVSNIGYFNRFLLLF